MKRSLTILISLLVVSALYGGFSYLPEFLQSKMNRQIGKLFGKQTNIVEIPIADSLDLDHQLFSLYIEDSVVGYSMISMALGCQMNGCDKPNPKNSSFEQFYFMTAFNNDKSIKKVRVLSYPSNHGYEVSSKSWLKQFENDSNFVVGQNIDGISGATISVKSITNGVNKQMEILDSQL